MRIRANDRFSDKLWQSLRVVLGYAEHLSLQVIARGNSQNHRPGMVMRRADHNVVRKNARLLLNDLPSLFRDRARQVDQIAGHQRNLNAIFFKDDCLRMQIVMRSFSYATDVIPRHRSALWRGNDDLCRTSAQRLRRCSPNKEKEEKKQSHVNGTPG